ncbi:metallophosphoesterase family protein [Streptoalloteichus hindustanus]|uniref:Calcineurin-like phosphoesterase n=1 Tax=Streptoalloteichus hindustanus TaxID=2017 RepID=A0A1M5BDZ2_STRHI|nr:metallophosphoesterase [Streptoalloteichus hindustanus]SHF40676.1 Calcineurin-like phosphoesterase [Streptoalloteichus hindustanus]
MRIHVVSDVHGNAEALARAGDGADALLVLGDLLEFVDYEDHSKGILGAVFGPERVARFAHLRNHGAPGEAGRYARSLWAELDDPGAVVEAAAREQYAAMFGALTAPTYATPGNVDAPALWPEFTDHIHVLDGEVTEIGGLRVGFVGGALLPPGGQLWRRNSPWAPHLRTAEDYAEAVAGLHAVDVLCSHIPPAVAELTYDVRARKDELGSTHLLELIHRQRPRWSLFGHVHQPLARRVRIGHTECVNVGHFRRSGEPFVLHW